MPNIAINIAGGSYKSRSGYLSSQKTQNFYPEIVDNPSSRAKYVLQSFPGVTLFSSGEAGLDRGMFEFQGVLYKVTGTTLYSVDSLGVHTLRGTISGAGRCIFEGIGADLIIVTNGKVWFYIKDPNVIDMRYASKLISVFTEEPSPTDITFSADETRMYILGTFFGRRIYQYSLSIAGDVSTASYTSNFLDVGSQDLIPGGLAIKSDGAKVYMGGLESNIYEYDLSTNYDVSTGTYNLAFFDISSEGATVAGLDFKPDGTKMYVLTQNSIFEYDLSAAWDVTSASYSSNTLDVSTEDTNSVGMSFNPGGTVVLILGRTNGLVFQYNLSVAWDISSATYSSQSLDVTNEEPDPSAGVYLGSSETAMYVIGRTNDTVYQYSSTGEVLDSDLETPNSVAHLNSRAIYDGDDARWTVSAVGNAINIDALDYATAEANPDNLLRVYVFNQLLYLMGEKTIEPWRNTGVGRPPYDRIEGGIIPVGLAAIYSAANNDNFLYFLGDDNRVYTIFGLTKENRSNIALSNAVDSYTVVSDAIGLCYSFDNQNFYQLTFPTEGVTWCYSESSGQWFELSSEGGRYLGNSYAFAYRKNLIADYRDGKIYELDLTAYDENGTTIQRIRDSGPIHGELLGAPGKTVEMTRFELIMEVGVGTASGQGSDPVVMLSFSDDGGKTFSTEMWGRIGKMTGEFVKVEWFALGSFYNRIIRVRTSDPVLFSIHSANADMEVGI